MSNPEFEGRVVHAAAGSLPVETTGFRTIPDVLDGRVPVESPPRSRDGLPEADAEVVVAFGLDLAYLPHAGVVVASLIANAPGAKFRFLIIHDGIRAEARSTFERCAIGHRFLWLQIAGSSVIDMPGKRHISRASYYRLTLAQFAPEEIERVLYLDADLVVMGDIRELFAADLGEYSIGAVADVGMDDRAFADRFSLHYRRLGYFNAGVLLMDLAKLRDSNDLAKVVTVLETRIDEMEYSDQCALNIVFWARWRPLDMLWNVQRRMLMPQENKPCFATAEEMKTRHRPKIIHFTEHNKPWSVDGWHPLIWTYYHYLKKTPYRAYVLNIGQVTLIKDLRRRLKTFLNWRRLQT